MWKVQNPLAWRRVWAFGDVAQIAHIALAHHFHEVFFIDALHFHGRIAIHQIEQGREAITQANTAAATVTNIKDALKLVIEFFFIVKIWVLPIKRVAG